MKWILSLLILTGVCWGQGAIYTNSAFQPGTGIPFAQIRVCTSVATGTPCTPTASVFTDETLVTPLSNPFFADVNGNFSFGAAAGIYIVQIFTAQGAPFQYRISMSPVAGNFVLTNPVGAQTITGQPLNLTTSAPLNPAIINTRRMCDQFAGATFDVKVTACIASVIAAGGGVADATGLTGTQTGTSEIDIGNVSSVPVTLRLSPFLTYQLTLISAGACGFKVFDGSRLIGTEVGTTHQAILQNGSATTATGSMICDNYGAGSGQYVSVQGVQVYNTVGGASNSNFTLGSVYLKNAFDTSSIRDMVISNQGGDGLVFQAACCGTLGFNIITDGNHVAGSRPLVIKSLTGDLQPVLGLSLINISADHPGAGLNAITIQHTYNSFVSPCVISFSGILYIEGNSTDTTTSLINIDSCTTVKIPTLVAQFRSVTSTAVPVTVTHTSVPGVSPFVELDMGVIQNSPQTFPATFVNDTANSITIKTDGQGMATYHPFPFNFIGQSPSGVEDSRFTPCATCAFHIRANVNNFNLLRLEDSTLSPRAIDLGPNTNSNTFFGIRDATGAGLLANFGWVTPFNTTLAGGLILGNRAGGDLALASTHLLISSTAPSIAGAGCGGTVATIPANNGPAAFTINTGTAPTSGGCTVTLPAATTDWVCTCTDRTTISVGVTFCRQDNSAASTTSAVLRLYSDVAVAAAPVANDVLRVSCMAY